MVNKRKIDIDPVKFKAIHDIPASRMKSVVFSGGLIVYGDSLLSLE